MAKNNLKTQTWAADRLMENAVLRFGFGGIIVIAAAVVTNITFEILGFPGQQWLVAVMAAGTGAILISLATALVLATRHG